MITVIVAASQAASRRRTRGRRCHLVLSIHRTRSGNDMLDLSSPPGRPEDGALSCQTDRIEPVLPLDLVTTRQYSSARITVFRLDHTSVRELDPVTNGHVDIRRAAAVFDRTVSVRDPTLADPLHRRRAVAFRRTLELVRQRVVDVFAELVVDFARKHDARPW
jgi:hypothetical protein